MAKKSEYDAIKLAMQNRKEELDRTEKKPIGLSETDVPEQEDTDEPSIVSRIVKKAGIAAKAAGSRLVGTPGDIQDVISKLTNYLAGTDPEVVRAWMQKYVEEDPEFGGMMMAPTSKEVKETVEQVVPQTIADTESEKRLQEGVELLADLTNPMLGGTSVAKGAIAAGVGIGAKAGLEALGLENYSEAGKLVGSIVPLVVSGKLQPSDPKIAKSLLSASEKLGVSEDRIASLKSYIASKEEAKELYQAGKAIGMTEQEMAPALASPSKIKKFAKPSASRESTAKKLAESKAAIGEAYNPLKEAGSKTKLSESASKNISSELKSIKKEAINVIGGESGLGPEGKEAVKKIDAWIIDLSKRQPNVDELINSYQRINADVNWSSVFAGKKNPLVGVRKSIESAISETSPEIGKKFQYMNKIYGKTSELKDLVDKAGANSMWTKDKLTKIILGAASLSYPKSTITLYAGSKAIPWLSEQFLLNPKFQNVISETSKAVAKNSPRLAKLAYEDFKKKVEEGAPKYVLDDMDL